MYRALIVDDEKHVRIAISCLGQWEQFQVSETLQAGNGREALEEMRRRRPEIVFVDIQMPIMSGLDFLDQASKEFPDTRYIVISGYDEFTYAQQAIRYGVVDYLLKPIVASDLNEALRRAVLALHADTMRMSESDYAVQNGTEGPAPDVEDEAEQTISSVQSVRKEAGEKEGRTVSPDQVIQMIHDYIGRNYSQNIRIADFAETYFFSREYLMRQFKARYGCGIYEYVLSVRMKRARELLLDPENKVQDIAHQVGYSDNNYFSRAFRTYYGEPPSSFRRAHGLQE